MTASSRRAISFLRLTKLPSTRSPLSRHASSTAHTCPRSSSAAASDGTGHLVMWCGLILQQPYRAVLERGFQPQTGGVYISYYLFGSPAHKYKLVPKHWVVEINGETVPHLRGFLAIVQAIPHGANVRIKTCDLNGKLFAHTVKTDHNYWRGYQLYFEEGSWVHKSMDEPPPKDEGG